MKPLSDLTAHCIRCGFCLESCPTFVVTGQETESPRGRIYLIRSADEGVLEWDRQVKQHIDTCLGCRACETACPSGVQYGEILELARDRLEGTVPQRPKKMLLDGMTSPRRMRMQLMLGRMLPGRKIPGFLSRWLSGQPAEVDKPKVQAGPTWPALDEQALPAIRGEVYLLEGCVMRVLYPRVHEATRRLLRRIGYVVRDVNAGCCGSLHAHNGYLDEAKSRARDLIGAMPDGLPVIVNSAGCGSTMKEYGALLGAAGPERIEAPIGDEPAEALSAEQGIVGTDVLSAAERTKREQVRALPNGFATHVFDASEFLLHNGLLDQLAGANGLTESVTYHDACHLAHGQHIRSEPRRLIEAIPGIEAIALEESDMCCGSAGIYNLTQPKLARQLLDRKWSNVEATRAHIVVTGNPGCHAWIEQASREHGGKVRVLHTMELLESAFSGLP